MDIHPAPEEPGRTGRKTHARGIRIGGSGFFNRKDAARPTMQSRNNCLKDSSHYSLPALVRLRSCCKTLSEVS